MLRIKCPWCGERDQNEFDYGGQANLVRPSNPEAAGDREWAEYLFYRINPRGVHHERWVHSWGCRQWLNVVRDTLTHEIHRVYAIGEPRDPNLPDEESVTTGSAPRESTQE